MKIIHGVAIGVIWLIMAVPLFSQYNSDCFLKDFDIKYILNPPPYQNQIKTATSATVTVTMNARDTLGPVSKYLYGNNANPYMTQMVDQPKLLQYITLLAPNIIRYPGGNLSSIFFWDRLPNQPPADAPDSLVDGSTGTKYKVYYWYGKDSNSGKLSVDNYYSMLDLTYSSAIITINYGYARYGTGPDPVAAAAHSAAEWVRYDDGRTKFWEIGNESDGPWQAGFQIDTSKNQDGQPVIVSGELYGKHFNVFADSMRKAAEEIGTTIYLGAQLIQYDARSSWNPPDRTWNDGFFKEAGDVADFFIIHTYYTNYNENSSASVILNSATTETVNMMNYMKQTTSNNHVSLKPIALTEWNIFAVGSKQMCSFVNGMHAAIVLGELARNKYSMSSRWDLANGYEGGNDHGMFNQGDEPGGVPKWNPRPPYFYMYYFQKYFGDHITSCAVTGSGNVLAYASEFNSGHAGIVVVNKGTTQQTIKLETMYFGYGDRYYIHSLTGGTDNGDFSQSVYVNGTAPTYATGGPIDGLEDIPAMAYSTEGEIKFTSPPRSVQYILIEPGNNISSVKNTQSPAIVDRYTLDQNYPNPFNPQTIISYSLPEASTVSLKVYDPTGRVIATLIDNESRTAGTHEVMFNAANLPSGIYFYELRTEKFAQTKKMVLVK